MYLILLIFGALLTVAGVVLAAAGISPRDHVFDAGIFTPGIVAAVGGLLLFGLGLALRVLQRIEEALSVRPMPKAARPGEADHGLAAPSSPGVPSLKSASTSAFAAKFPVGPGKGTEAAEKSPVIAPLDSPDPSEDADVSLAPRPSPAVAASRVDHAVAEVDRARARRKNGVATGRITSRLDLSARQSAPEVPKGPTFDALWPKAPRPARTTQATPMAQVPSAEIEPASETDTAADLPIAQDDTSAEATILKSGIVDGMAYTLYSDGSIEAALPQGTLRFGSITELRNHIEQAS
jgi:hypothetical protein